MTELKKFFPTKESLVKCKGQSLIEEQLPQDFPPAFTVEHLVKLTQQKEGQDDNPAYALIDSQSVKTTHAADQKGFDMGKKRKEEKES